MALIQLARGRLDAAALTYEQAMQSLVTSGRPRPPDRARSARPRSPTSGMSSTWLAARGQGHRAVPAVVYTPPLAGGLATLAMIRQGHW